MKYSLRVMAATLAAGCNAALAAEYGAVISSTPVTAEVAVPQQKCLDTQQLVPPRTSGAGAVLGAVVGGVIGNDIGGGIGRAAATGLGVVAGAALGDRAEAARATPAATEVRSCQTEMRYENRVLGYDVTYDYRGQRYSTRLAQDPGTRIALDVTVAPAADTDTASPPTPLPSPMLPAPGVVYAPAPIYGYDGYYGYYGYYGYNGPTFEVVPRIVIGAYRHRGF